MILRQSHTFLLPFHIPGPAELARRLAPNISLTIDGLPAADPHEPCVSSPCSARLGRARPGLRPDDHPVLAVTPTDRAGPVRRGHLAMTATRRLRLVAWAAFAATSAPAP